MTKIIVNSLLWFNESERTVTEVNAYLFGMRNAGLNDSNLAEISQAFSRSQEASKVDSLVAV